MRIRSRIRGWLTVAAWLSVWASGLPAAFAADADSPAPVDAEQLKFFEQHIRPLLVENCFKCHGPEKQSGGLRVDSLSALLAGGDSGPALQPGGPTESLLIEAINYGSYEMPPDGKLSDEQIALLTRWVEMGAPWPGDDGTQEVRTAGREITADDRAFWCYQPLRHPATPQLERDDWSRTDVDRFILAALNDAGLAPQAEADRLTLIRRVTQIVTGLPPTVAEIDAFLSDDSPHAYETLVDRLLESPRRGEHLARFWLDLVRYAESDGYKQDDYRPDAWRYRDYVIRSFSADKPYDLFILEQLAGDELYPHNPEALAATGYYRHGIYEYNQRDAATQWRTMLEDITETTSDAFLAMGLGCAKCHDHKFDPLLQADYYRLQAFFSSLELRDGQPFAAPAELAAYHEKLRVWEEATASVRAELEALEKPKLDKLAAGAVKVFAPEFQEIWHKPAAERNAYEHQIAHLIYLQVLDAQQKLNDQFKGDEKIRREELQAELAKFDELKPSPLPRGQAAGDVAAPTVPVMIPGKSRMGEIAPGFPVVLGDDVPEIFPPELAPQSTGRRSALARWLVREDHPLTGRVIVNRLWQQHFGVGLVATTSDFGHLGEKPSHPELLDWLATEFVAHGWSIKWLQKQILLSAVFRQSSARTGGQDPEAVDPELVDPAGRLLWRFPVRRLSAEQIRDAMLATSGELDLKAGGPGNDFSSTRRAVYLKVLRNRREDLLEVFDFPDRITSAGERNVTTTPTQSLLMINSDWTAQRAAALARRLTQTVPSGDDSRIREAYRLAFGRDPSERELLRDADFLRIRRDSEPVRADQGVSTKSMLLTGSPAAAIGERPGESPLRLDDLPQQPLQDATIEAVVLLKSVYPDASVRSIVSRWDGDTQHVGWSLGVTSTKSAHKPRNLILQIVGDRPDGKRHYEVVASGLHLELDRPYYVACAVHVADDGAATATFHVRDLVDQGGKLQTSVRPVTVASGVQPSDPLTIGGRHGTDRHRWDGLIDELRITQGLLAPGQFLAAAKTDRSAAGELPPAAILGHWTFDDAARPLADSSGSGRDLVPAASRPTVDAPLIDFCHVLLNSNEFLYLN